jgi:hypothetical protein
METLAHREAGEGIEAIRGSCDGLRGLTGFQQGISEVNSRGCRGPQQSSASCPPVWPVIYSLIIIHASC